MNLLHPRTLEILPSYQHLQDFILSLPDRFKRQEGEVLYKGRNELRIFEYEGTDYVVKSFRTPHFINRLVYGTLRPSKAKRSFDNAQILSSIGVGTPQPIAYLNIRNGMLFTQSYYITLKAQCSHIYYELFEKKFPYEEEVLRAIGRMTATLHNHGYAHKDYGRGNILFEKTEKGILLELVDLNRMAVGPLDINAGCKNLERLPATPQMHRWIAEEYAQARGFETEKCFELMQQYRSVQPGKIDGKY